MVYLYYLSISLILEIPQSINYRIQHCYWPDKHATHEKWPDKPYPNTYKMPFIRPICKVKRANKHASARAGVPRQGQYWENRVMSAKLRRITCYVRRYLKRIYWMDQYLLGIIFLNSLVILLYWRLLWWTNWIYHTTFYILWEQCHLLTLLKKFP